MQAFDNSSEEQDAPITMYSPTWPHEKPLISRNRRHRGRSGAKGIPGKHEGWQEPSSKGLQASGDLQRWYKAIMRWLDDIASLFYLSALLSSRTLWVLTIMML